MPDLMKEIHIEMKNKSNSEVNRLTREAITTALVKLLRYQTFDRISISAIVKLAGVSRTAYYNNYQSKTDILTDLINNFINDINNSLQPYAGKTSGKLNQPREFIDTLFNSVYQHKNVYETLIKANLSQQLLKQLNSLMIKYKPAKTINEKYQVYFQTGALFNVFTLWIENGTKESCGELSQMFTQRYDSL
ncbi:TetR/AcrR family transcriptional regulator C-terminal domain-containing protein [Leuconostoc suionicum]|uniref:TetR/AcrR family transcriptional regulator n=1 Tax=Leuconostoc suionicum TaxID=1511761 RepID=UPI00233E86E4|nr:TetR/AcrR family transcriptional regulator [Leuconostoc suionicum]MDC2817424.1 TetR/AcrR family transcriptional regulator C-terminal domain-containing protein [Leuconostoc suionicum]